MSAFSHRICFALSHFSHMHHPLWSLMVPPLCTMNLQKQWLVIEGNVMGIVSEVAGREFALRTLDQEKCQQLFVEREICL